MILARHTRNGAILALVAGMACAHSSSQNGSSATELLTYDIEIGEQSLSSVHLVAPWELAGPGSVSSIGWTLNIEGEAEIKGTAKPESQTTGKLELSAELPTTDEAFAARSEKTALRFNIEAMFAVTTPDGNDTFEAQWHGEIFPPKRPEVSVKPQAARYGSMTEFNFTLVIKNPNPFSVDSEGLVFSVLIDEIELSEGTVAAGLTLTNGSETEYDIQRQTSRTELPEIATKIQGRKNIPYRVETTLTVEGLELATPLTGEIVFPR